MGIARLDSNLARELSRLGARDMEICMQCAACSASCPLSSDGETFPRRIYRTIQLGLEEELLAAPEPWLCYYCGECNQACPRGAEPAETMMAARRWLTTRYDWTGLSRRLYASPAWQLAAFAVVALGVALAFVYGHGPIVTERVELTAFAPVAWVALGDKIMLGAIGALMLSNGIRMHRRIMGGVRPSPWLYLTQAWTFVLNYLTQIRWKRCGVERRGRWIRHLLLFSGYVTMEVLVVGFLDYFQTDLVHPLWHPTRIFGYYATVALMIVSADMLVSRRRKQELLHRTSDFTDWFFLALLFATAFSGIIVHGFRLAGWPWMTYIAYVLHLAIAVGMLCIMLPFGKLSHLFYRPLAIFFTAVRRKASPASAVPVEQVAAEAGALFQSCLHCGVCTSLCPAGPQGALAPRRLLRAVALESGSLRAVEQASFDCLTCNACAPACPRGIGIIEVIRSVRAIAFQAGKAPAFLRAPLENLRGTGSPFGGAPASRRAWAGPRALPQAAPAHDGCLFTCCATAADPAAAEGGRALLALLAAAGVSFGTLGGAESCCGDLARQAGERALFEACVRRNTDHFARAGVRRILTASPHCLDAFRSAYPGLNGVRVEHHSELLDRLLAAGRLSPARPLSLTVAYHDPCYLARHHGITAAPRRVLARIPGLSVVEFSANREEGLCCGGGGGNLWRRDPQRLDLAVRRVEEAIACGAQAIATACPACVLMLAAAARRRGLAGRVAVMDIAQLLAQSIVPAAGAGGPARGRVSADPEVCHA
jgi:Fe-S oxidoreductase